MNSKSIIEDYDKNLSKVEAKAVVYEDSIKTLKDENFEGTITA